jgi:predicted HTH domain antitoxin
VTLTVEIPDELVQARHLSPSSVSLEVRKEVALALYTRGLVSAGKAAEFAQVTRQDFEELLASRRIERPYDEEELERDLAWAKKGTV